MRKNLVALLLLVAAAANGSAIAQDVQPLPGEGPVPRFGRQQPGGWPKSGRAVLKDGQVKCGVQVAETVLPGQPSAETTPKAP